MNPSLVKVHPKVSVFELASNFPFVTEAAIDVAV
jgi:hypothetical protein